MKLVRRRVEGKDDERYAASVKGLSSDADEGLLVKVLSGANVHDYQHYHQKYTDNNRARCSSRQRSSRRCRSSRVRRRRVSLRKEAHRSQTQELNGVGFGYAITGESSFLLVVPLLALRRLRFLLLLLSLREDLGS